MYKRMTFEELTQIKNPLLENMYKIMMKQKIPLFKKFLKHQASKGEKVIFFQRSTPQIELIFNTKPPQLRDITNRIELVLNEDTINKCHNLLKNKKKITKMNINNKSIDELLRNEFVEGEHRLIEGKPYLVYDIETTYATNNLRDAKFLIAYVINSDPEGKANFQHIPDIRAKEFFDYMLDFDGWIIGYNHVGFDNPVLGYNAGASEKDIQKLQEKSIDPFLFLQKKLKRRVGLNSLSKALVNVGKTLESGTEAEKLYNDFHENGNKKAMNELKKYCKNDVKMTLLVWLALVKQKKIWREGEEVIFNSTELIEGSRSHLEIKKEDKQNSISRQKDIFGK